MRRSAIIGLLVLALAGWFGQRLERNDLPHDEADELHLYPSGRLLGLLSLGQPTLLADFAWLQAIQYYGKHRMGDRRYPLAEHLFDVITTIDPSFGSAYIFGALVLEEQNGTLGPSRRLLGKGIWANPQDWRIVFHRGFLEYLRGDPGVGAVEMERASRLPGAPPYAARLAAYAHTRSGRIERARRIWKEIARQSQDPAMRALAEERLEELEGASGEPREGHVAS